MKFTLSQLEELNVLTQEFPDETMNALDEQFQTETDPAIKQALNGAFITGAVLLNSQYGRNAFPTDGLKVRVAAADLDGLDLTVPPAPEAPKEKRKSNKEIGEEKDEARRLEYEYLTGMPLRNQEEIDALEVRSKAAKLTKEQRDVITTRLKAAKEGLFTAQSKREFEILKKRPLKDEQDILNAIEAAKAVKLTKEDKKAFDALIKDAKGSVKEKKEEEVKVEKKEAIKKRGSKVRIDDFVMSIMAKMINRGDKNKDIANFFAFDAANVSDLKSGYGRYKDHSEKLIKAKNENAEVAAPDEYKDGEFVKDGIFDWTAYAAYKESLFTKEDPKPEETPAPAPIVETTNTDVEAGLE